MEESFLRFSWKDNKIVTRNTFLVISFLTLVFPIRDFIELGNSQAFYLLLFLRAVYIVFTISTSVYIHKSANYFSKYLHLVFCNQIMISVFIFILAIIREMPIAYLGVNTILFSLIFYQLLNNKFHYTLIASGFIGFGAIITSFVFLNMNHSDFLASILFLFPLNYLGITILRSINRTRRNEYLALMDLRKTNHEKEKVILELQGTLDEVKTLRGFLPICSHCKKIRDDQGYWNQIESYIEAHSDAQFSHGMCQDCAEEIYGEYKWYKKQQKAKEKEEQ